MKRILAVVAAATGLLVGTGQAAAATASDGPAAQALGQAAGSGQTAGRSRVPRRASRRTRTSPFAS